MSFEGQVRRYAVYQCPAPDFCSPRHCRHRGPHKYLANPAGFIAEDFALAGSRREHAEQDTGFVNRVLSGELAQTVEDEELA